MRASMRCAPHRSNARAPRSRHGISSASPTWAYSSSASSWTCPGTNSARVSESRFPDYLARLAGDAPDPGATDRSEGEVLFVPAPHRTGPGQGSAALPHAPPGPRNSPPGSPRNSSAVRSLTWRFEPLGGKDGGDRLRSHGQIRRPPARRRGHPCGKQTRTRRRTSAGRGDERAPRRRGRRTGAGGADRPPPISSALNPHPRAPADGTPST